MKLRLLSAAFLEMIDVARGYEEQRVGLGDAFMQELESAIQRISTAPLQFGTLETIRGKKNVRRCILSPYSYVVIYQCHFDEIVIIAIVHAKRRPSFWRDRLE